MKHIKQIAFSAVLLSLMTVTAHARDNCNSENNQVLKEKFQNAANYYSNHERHHRGQDNYNQQFPNNQGEQRDRGQENAQNAQSSCQNAINDLNDCRDNTNNIQRCEDTQYYHYCYGSGRNRHSNMGWLTDKCVSVNGENNSSNSRQNEQQNWLNQTIDNLQQR